MALGLSSDDKNLPIEFTVRCVPSNGGAALAAKYKAHGYEPVGCTGLLVNGRLDIGRPSGVGIAQFAHDKYFATCEKKPLFVTPDKFSLPICCAIAAMSGIASPVPALEALSLLADQRTDDRFMVPTLKEAGEAFIWAQLALLLAECEDMPVQLAYAAGVGRLKALTQNRISDELMARVLNKSSREQARVEAARIAAKSMKVLGSGVIFLVAEAGLWGFDIWHNEGVTGLADGAACVVVHRKKDGFGIGSNFGEISVRTTLQAENMFGPNGLQEVLPRIRPLTKWTGNSVHASSQTGLTQRESESAAELLRDEARNRLNPHQVIKV